MTTSAPTGPPPPERDAVHGPSPAALPWAPTEGDVARIVRLAPLLPLRWVEPERAAALLVRGREGDGSAWFFIGLAGRLVEAMLLAFALVGDSEDYPTMPTPERLVELIDGVVLPDALCGGAPGSGAWFRTPAEQLRELVERVRDLGPGGPSGVASLLETLYLVGGLPEETSSSLMAMTSSLLRPLMGVAEGRVPTDPRGLSLIEALAAAALDGERARATG